MIPYFILLISVVLLSYIAKKIKRDKVTYYFIIFLIFLFLVLFAGLRNYSVGTDTGTYINIFNSFLTKDLNFFEYTGSIELGYVLLQKVVLTMSHDYILLLIFIAIIILFFYLKTIYTLSSNFTISIFLFITLGTYLFFFNGARQGLAAAIFSFAIIAAIHGNYKKYYFWVFIAFFFHKSVLITIPFYFILRQAYTLKNFIKLNVFLIVFLFLLYQLSYLLPQDAVERYSQYIDRGATGGYILTLFHIISLLFYIFMKRYISYRKKKIYTIYLYLSTIHTSIFIIVTIMGLDVNILRLSLYFALGPILIWPIILSTLKNNIQLFIFFIFIIAHLLFFYMYLSSMARLTPYILNS